MQNLVEVIQMSLVDKIKEIKQEEQEAIRKRNVRLEECRRTIMEDQTFKKIEIAGIHKDIYEAHSGQSKIFY